MEMKEQIKTVKEFDARFALGLMYGVIITLTVISVIVWVAIKF